MKNINNYEDRLDINLKISEEVSVSGVLDIINFLTSELKEFLKIENRFFGLAKSYMNTIESTFIKINNKIDEEMIDIFDRLLYLYKPILLKEFKRLKQKKLSSGDCIICIVKKLLEIVLEYESSNKEAKTLKKIIDKFYDNIRNKSKLDHLFYLSNFTKTNISLGNIGKYKINSISFIDQEIPKEKFEGNNLKIDELGDNNLLEIDI